MLVRLSMASMLILFEANDMELIRLVFNLCCLVIQSDGLSEVRQPRHVGSHVCISSFHNEGETWITCSEVRW